MFKKKNGDLSRKSNLGYSSQIALVISLIAGSVGTGNIWRFPRVAAANGGGAFVVAYLILMAVVIIPLMIGEHAIGRATRHGMPGAFRDFVGKKYTWLGTIVAIIMAMTAAYYSAVLAWVLHYMGLAFIRGFYGVDKAALFTSVSNGNIITVILFVLILGISAFIAFRGVKGIEKANKVFIPVLFISLLACVIGSLSLPGAATGLNYLFGFKIGDFLNGKMWLEALTQCVWSAGPGWGLVITLAVFSAKKSDIALTSTINGIGDTLAAMLAGLAVIPAVFALSASPDVAMATMAGGNNGLTFISMTSLFEVMPGGYILGILFFISLFMAGLSSNVVHFLICSLPIIETGKSKKKSIIGIFLLLIVWGLPSAWNATFLSNQDWVVGQMMVIGCMFSCFALIKYGTKKVRTTLINNPYSGLKIGKWWDFSIKFLAPAIAVIMFIWWSVQSLGWEANWWTPFGVNNLGTFIFQGGLMAIIAFLFNNKVADATKHKYFDGETFPDVPDNNFAA